MFKAWKIQFGSSEDELEIMHKEKKGPKVFKQTVFVSKKKALDSDSLSSLSDKSVDSMKEEAVKAKAQAKKEELKNCREPMG